MAQLSLSFSSPWAIRRAALKPIVQISAYSFDDENWDQKYYGANINAIDGTVIIPVRGILEQRLGLWGWLSGGSSYDEITMQIKSALDDESISKIILDFDSPGGSVLGVAELAELIFQARARKPIIAIANNLCGSAAYWLASACSEVVLSSTTSIVGSIGVVSIHSDLSKAEDRAGIKITEIVAGQFKRVASSHAPLGDEGRSVLQEQVDQIYGIFLDAVGKHLGLSAADVHEKMGDGRDFIGQRAIDAGLARRIESFSTLLSQPPPRGIAKEITPMGMRAEEQSSPVPKKPEEAVDEAQEEEEKKKKAEEEEKMEEMGEEHKEKECPAMAVRNERARISAILNLSGISIDSLTQEAITKGISKEGYALRVLETRPKKLAAMERESRSVPPWEATSEETKIIANACKSVNDAKTLRH